MNRSSTWTICRYLLSDLADRAIVVEGYRFRQSGEFYVAVFEDFILTVDKSTSQMSDYTGKGVKAIVLDGQRVDVGSWRAAMEAILGLVISKDKPRFEQVAPQIVGKKRPYFTPNPDLLRNAGQIPNTALFFETNLSATYIAKIATELVERMGYPPATLLFVTE